MEDKHNQSRLWSCSCYSFTGLVSYKSHLKVQHFVLLGTLQFEYLRMMFRSVISSMQNVILSTFGSVGGRN
uniref:Uncharacterized protein n=1 Tax=Physcomitrium patens TaxID=3218 RepID=A0A2K1JXB8_PHYPA|nr:hypothetical protein PHYPA_013258 [Physcomitrium patens]